MVPPAHSVLQLLFLHWSAVVFIARSKFDDTDRQMWVFCGLHGTHWYTEGAIPFAVKDLAHPSCNRSFLLVLVLLLGTQY